MKKALLIILAFIILLCFCPAALAANSIPAPVLSARSSTVYIEVSNALGVYAGGSGFAIGDSDKIEYIVTNHHVIEGIDVSVTVYYGDNSSVGASVYADIPRADMCVLKLDKPIYGMQPLALYDGSTADLSGIKVYALGFPASADEIFIRNGTQADDITVTDGVISSVKRTVSSTSSKEINAIQSNVAITSGNSGGPLLNEKGVVVGVNTFGSYSDANIAGSVCITELLTTLEANAIPFIPGSGSLNVPLLLIILAAAVVVVILIILGFKRRKKMKQAKTPESPAPVQGIPFDTFVENHGGKLSYEMCAYTLLPLLNKLATDEAGGKCGLCIYPENITVSPTTGRASLGVLQPRSVPGYSAPEQYRQDSSFGAWTEVYQVGALIYRLLTGKTLPDVMDRYDDDSTVKAEIAAAAVTEEQRSALLKAIALKYSDRFIDMRSFMEALGMEYNAFASFEPTPSAVSAEAAAPAKAPVKHKKRLVIALCVIGVVAFLGIFAGVTMYHYNTAFEFFTDGRYDEAYREYKKIPINVGDIGDMRDYSHAQTLYESNDYKNAGKEFKKLGSFLDSKELADECSFSLSMDEAYDLILNGDAKKGDEAFTSLSENANDEEKQAIEYRRATAYYDYGDLSKASEIYKSLGDYSDSAEMYRLSVLADAASYILEGDFLTAYDILLPLKDISAEAAAEIDELASALYDAAIVYFDEEDYASALDYFSALDYYKNSKDYASVLSADSVFDVIPYLYSDDERLVEYADALTGNDPMIYEYLTGEWSGDGYSFVLDKDDSTYYDLPDEGFSDYAYYYIEDNIYYVYNDDPADGAPLFSFVICEDDYMCVICRNEEIYDLYRQ